MIVRYYKRYYLELPESEMTMLDGLIDGIVTFGGLYILMNGGLL